MNDGRCGRLCRSGVSLGVSEVGAVDSTLLDLLRRCGITNHAFTVKLDFGGRCALSKLASTKDIVILANLGDAALLVAWAWRSWDIRYINASVGVVAVSDTVVKSIRVRGTSLNWKRVSDRSQIWINGTYCHHHSGRSSIQWYTWLHSRWCRSIHQKMGSQGRHLRLQMQQETMQRRKMQQQLKMQQDSRQQ